MNSPVNWKEYVLSFLTKNFSSHVLLYHSCYPEIPKDLEKNLHNVTPECLFEQLSWYKKNFDIVTLEDWFNSKNRRGLAAITFDDAYKSVFQYGLNILEDLNLPATIFIIGSTLNGKIFWRDKVRFLDAYGLNQEFLDYIKTATNMDINLDPDEFYEHSKKHSFVSILSNSDLDKVIDVFLKEKNLLKTLKSHCIEYEEEIIDHPLISYGNHSYSHYILSTLTNEEIDFELKHSHEQIKNLTEKSFIDLLSVPFGGRESVNEHTLSVCKELNIKGLLLSTNKLNHSKHLQEIDGIPVVNRFLLPGSLDEMKSKINMMAYEQFKDLHPFR